MRQYTKRTTFVMHRDLEKTLARTIRKPKTLKRRLQRLQNAFKGASGYVIVPETDYITTKDNSRPVLVHPEKEILLLSNNQVPGFFGSGTYSSHEKDILRCFITTGTLEEFYESRSEPGALNPQQLMIATTFYHSYGNINLNDEVTKKRGIASPDHYRNPPHRHYYLWPEVHSKELPDIWPGTSTLPKAQWQFATFVDKVNVDGVQLTDFTRLGNLMKRVLHDGGDSFFMNQRGQSGFTKGIVPDTSKPKEWQDVVTKTSVEDVAFYRYVDRLYSSLEEQTDIHQVLADKVYDKLEGAVGEMDLGIYFGELGETAEMLKSTLNILIDCYKAIARFDFKAAKRLLTKVTAHKNRPVLNTFSATSSLYLYKKFGVDPFLEDMQSFYNLLRFGMQKGCYFYVEAFVEKDLSGVNLPGPPNVKILRDYRLNIKSGKFLTRQMYNIDDISMFLLGAFGLTQPLKTFYELLPLSFVLDWFLPLSEYATIDDASRLGLSIASSSISGGLTYEIVGKGQTFKLTTHHRLNQKLMIGGEGPLAALSFGQPFGQISNKVVKLRGIDDEGKFTTLAALASSIGIGRRNHRDPR